jgi:hypothetical protein
VAAVVDIWVAAAVDMPAAAVVTAVADTGSL